MPFTYFPQKMKIAERWPAFTYIKQGEGDIVSAVLALKPGHATGPIPNIAIGLAAERFSR